MSQTPGPDKYSVDTSVVKPKAPIYSIRGRQALKDTSITPGPKYNVPSTLGQKAYTM